jgi:hypothetical protein
MKKIPQVYKYMVLLGVIIAVNTLAIALYVKSPIYTINEYIHFINEQKYAEAISFIRQDLFTDEAFEVYMENYFTTDELIGVIKKGEVSKSTDEYIYEIEYLFSNSKITTNVKLFREENRWIMDLPFAKQAVLIYAPLGTKVFLENQEVVPLQEGIYQTKELLEGEYTLEMLIPTNEGIKKVHQIRIPDVKSISFGYEPCEITVKTEPSMEVSLAGVSKISEDGKVTFSPLMAGNYTLEVKDLKGNKQNFKESITIHTSSQQKEIPSLPLSQLGEQNVLGFMENFYKDYVEGIKNKEDTFLQDYVTKEYEKEGKIVFNSWFIEGKDVQEASLKTYYSPLLEEEDKIKIETFEEIYLTNKEEKSTTYRIGIGWENVLVYNKGEFFIEDRQMKESIIAYQNEKGEWLQY